MPAKREPTAFESRVYAALKRIPKGKVTTYGHIAKALKVGSSRAIGGACGRNPFAPRIPCHRVVRSDGSLGGYSGGLKKKVALLKKEGISCDAGKIKNFNQKLFRF